MSQNDVFSQIKNMDKRERNALLEKLMGALSPEQQKMVQNVVRDKKQMEKVQNNLKSEDISALIAGLSGGGDARDFLQSPQVIDRLKEILR